MGRSRITSQKGQAIFNVSLKSLLTSTARNEPSVSHGIENLNNWLGGQMWLLAAIVPFITKPISLFKKLETSSHHSKVIQLLHHVSLPSIHPFHSISKNARDSLTKLSGL